MAEVEGDRERQDHIDSCYIQLFTLRKKIDTFHNALLERIKKSATSDDDNESISSTNSNFDSTSVILSENPLLIPYIFEIVAHNLPMQDLRSCRLVCQLWNKESSRVIQKQRHLFLSSQDTKEVEAVLKSKKNGNYVSVASLCIFGLTYPNPLGMRLLYHFGHTLSELKLEECNLTASNLFDVFTKLAPNLESFSMSQKAIFSCQPESEESDPDWVPSTLAQLKEIDRNLQLPKLKQLEWSEIRSKVQLYEIIEMFPNLVDLDFYICCDTDIALYRGLKFDSLKQLCLSPNDTFRDHYFDVLASLQLKVSKITLYQLQLAGKKRIDRLKRFLMSVSGTLEELYLYKNTATDPQLRYSPFPVNLPKLSNLVVQPGFVTSMKLFNCTPNLKRFKCKFSNSRHWSKILKSELPEPLSGVEYLSAGCADATALSTLTKIFPNLTELQLNCASVDDNAFRVIVSGMPSLKHLRLSSSSSPLLVTDSGITGIPPEALERLKESEELVELDQFRKHPFIGDLKNLSELELESQGTELTDASIFFGLVHVKDLRVLTMPSSKISGKSLQRLLQFPYLMILGVENCSNVSEEDITKLQKERPEMLINSFSRLGMGMSLFPDC